MFAVAQTCDIVRAMIRIGTLNKRVVNVQELPVAGRAIRSGLSYNIGSYERGKSNRNLMLEGRQKSRHQIRKPNAGKLYLRPSHW